MPERQDMDHGLRNYTVLHHTGVDSPHFDFLFDTSDDSQLITFRLDTWPVFQSQNVTKLRDHRRAYLTYAGQISGDRGRVDQVDQGRIRVVKDGKGWRLSYEDGRQFALLEPMDGGEPDQWIMNYLG